MLYPQLEQRLQASKQAVNTAMSESIVKAVQRVSCATRRLPKPALRTAGYAWSKCNSPHPFPDRRSTGSENDS
jgi:hypothetical protein